MKVNDFYVSIRHTTKVDINDKVHRLPPDHGPFKEYKVADYICPPEWSNDGYFIPVEEGQPLWIDFRGNGVCACILSVQRFNPISNEPANLQDGLKKDPRQNYLVLPNQPWVDGYTKDGKVYQFVVTKAGEGLAVNEFVLPKEMQDSHAIGLAFFLPKNAPSRNLSQPIDIIDGRIDRTSYQLAPYWFSPLSGPNNWQINSKRAGIIDYTYEIVDHTSSETANVFSAIPSADGLSYSANSMCHIGDIDMLENSINDLDKASMAAGGRIEQEIVTDPNTIEYYQEKPALVLPIYLALPALFKSIMDKGRRQDASKKDKYVHSGEIGGVQVPLLA